MSLMFSIYKGMEEETGAPSSAMSCFEIALLALAFRIAAITSASSLDTRSRTVNPFLSLILHAQRYRVSAHPLPQSFRSPTCDCASMRRTGHVRGISTSIQQTLHNVQPQFRVVELDGEVEGRGAVDAVYGVDVAVFMREDVFEDVGGGVEDAVVWLGRRRRGGEGRGGIG